MTSDLYACRCSCGAMFVSLYPSTQLCPSCCPVLLGEWSDCHALADCYDGFDYQMMPNVEDPFAAAYRFSMIAETRRVFADVLDSLSRKTGRWNSTFALVLIVLLLLGMGYALSMAQAWTQGWDR